MATKIPRKTFASATDELFAALTSHPYGRDESRLAERVARLAAQGADINAQRPHPMDSTCSWHSPLSWALSARLERCALALIPFADPLARFKQGQGFDLLMNAIGIPKALKALLAAGSDPWRRDDKGRSALMYALRFAAHEVALGHPRDSVAALLPVSDALAVDKEGYSVPDWLDKCLRGPAPAWVESERQWIMARAQAQRMDACASRGRPSGKRPGL